MPEYGELDKNLIARYIGIKDGVVDERTNELMEKAEKMLAEDAKPVITYSLNEISGREGGLGFKGLALKLSGDDIKKLLENSERVILLCATLGSKVDARIRQLQVNDPLSALIYDASASVAIDQLCDALQEEIKEKLPDYEHTMRFSPGYGDLPLEVQGDFLRAVNAEKRAGVSLTAGGMLTPVKTITAVFGLVPKRAAEDKIIEGSEQFGNEKRGCGETITCEACPRNKSCSMSAAGKE